MNWWVEFRDSFADNVFPVYSGLLEDFSFDTIIPGGFGSASFSIPISSVTRTKVALNNYLNYYVLIYDRRGITVYEGRITAIDSTDTFVSFRATGLYSHGDELINGLIYPISTAKSISQIVSDAIALTSYWSKDYGNVLNTTTDVTPQDFTGETKITESIEEVLKYGGDGVDPVALNFAIWDRRTPFLFEEPNIDDDPDWLIPEQSVSFSGGFTQSIDLNDVFNKIQVLYDDPDIGQTFTDYYENAESQAVYGVREGSINIGKGNSVIADVVGTLAKKYYAYPGGTATLGISGFVKRLYGGSKEYPYLIRAGDLVRLEATNPAILDRLNPEETRKRSFSFVVSRTSYRSTSNVLQVQYEKRNKSMDILLSRLGASTASVR